ncbi:MAG TPA: DUF2232 domain-containing protein [Azospirillum sp.]|nr:DUF2232 domain-containing protein [Azospirillum sp.]
MPTALVAALGGGVVSALLYVSVVFAGVGALILGYLAPLPLFLVGLWVGTAGTGIAGAAGAVAVLAATGSFMGVLGYVLTGAVPAAFVVRQALRARQTGSGDVEWYPPGLLLLGLTGFGVAAFFIAVVLALGEPGGLEGMVRRTLQGMARQFVAPGEAPPSPEAFWLAPALPGLVVVSWLTMTIVNAALAQGLLMRFGRNRRPPMRLAEMELPGWVVLAFAGMVAAAAVLPDGMGFLALNVALVLSLPFGLAGLSVVHAFAQRQSAKVALLVGFYLFLFLFGWPILLLIGLGVIEQWIGLRRRWARVGPDQEDE